MTRAKRDTTRYRVRFSIDEDAQFEECNGEARPLTAEEYPENAYRACPDHLRAGTQVLQMKPIQIQGCATCRRPGTEYIDIPYEEYRAYYGNPDRHVYLYVEVQKRCQCCGEWSHAGGVGHVDFMDDSPEYLAVDLGRWYSWAEARQLPGYLREVIQDARD